ncbi:hypothetical protein SCA6_015189 [Theobroma cacao]|uniref:Uncharacterized protein isoform 1 n=2 Tax=Theobroma cacao TaxID=3641 RepID=A0A061DUI5_THECC|nr:PREDICTED: uncharacterized protein LOC18614199 isoform X1 [Theobroma cacao]XP_007051900.1 PREDICTED: uncharacterized protein LOC18614199 isoform X1 [Theobroma cacao]XP_017969534.1 PREDICTED: uncharacterized protein LOC18614199 isoform X1 [Theobroma cacao]XP_017969535.1 PREDICTED: uncharacterized protein LOC18614199 isoform X1 [Theobroma cacao]EOX96056.1 Uncharacterized protein TCM_005401 isoform 1 [Theobroma cacao]EOX96057.1 Uncharacterized protein TCM_005401 isoform 1 [Theobroma cacao]
MAVVSVVHWFVAVLQYRLEAFYHLSKHGTFQISNHKTRGRNGNTWLLKFFTLPENYPFKYLILIENLDENSSRPIPDRWMLVVKEQKGGSRRSYYSCPETGQKFYTYEDLMRYVNYAKAAKLSIYSPNFRPINPRKPKKKASVPDVDQSAVEKSSDSEDSTFKLPSIASLELMEVVSPSHSDKQSASGKSKLENQSSNEACSSERGKGKKQKK